MQKNEGGKGFSSYRSVQTEGLPALAGPVENEPANIIERISKKTKIDNKKQTLIRCWKNVDKIMWISLTNISDISNLTLPTDGKFPAKRPYSSG